MSDAPVLAPWISVKTFAGLCGVDASVVYRWIKSGDLTALKLPGGDYRLTPEDIEDFKRRCRGQGSPDLSTGSSYGEGSGPSPGPTPNLVDLGPFRRGQKIAKKPRSG